MKSWYDLSKEDKKNYKKEFKSKRKVIDLRIIFYVLTVLSFFPLLIVTIAKSNIGCYGNACDLNIVKFGSLFLIFLVCAIINSTLINKNEKEFISWLKARNIEK